MACWPMARLSCELQATWADCLIGQTRAHFWNIFFFRPFQARGPSSSCLSTLSLMVMLYLASSPT